MPKSLGETNYQDFENRYASTIRNHPFRLYYELPAFQSLLGLVGGLRVLDGGCGGGDYTVWCLEQGAQVTACDLMPEFVRLTASRVQGRAQVFQADLNYPLNFAKDNTFDLIFSALTLHYLPDWKGVLGEFRRVLKPSGRLVFSVMHPMNDTQQINYFETGLYETVWQNFGEPYPVIKLYHRPLMAILNGLIQAGFHLEQVLEPYPLPKFADHAPADYAALCQQPIFLMVAAHL